MSLPTRFPPMHAKTPNLHDKDDPSAPVERCAWCGDDGWLTLEGTITIGGVTTERGMVPCRGCKLGAKIHAYQITKWRRFEDYTEDDVDRSAIPVDPAVRAVYHRPPRLSLVTPDQLAAAPFDGDEPPPPPGKLGDQDLPY